MHQEDNNLDYYIEMCEKDNMDESTLQIDFDYSNCERCKISQELFDEGRHMDKLGEVHSKLLLKFACPKIESHIAK
jgi:hypothetical protein